MDFLNSDFLGALVTALLQFFMVFGGLLPYLPQYYTIYRTRDAQGFSTLVCFVILVSQILRILFWFGKHYELPLLFQSIVMILVMLAMLQVCTLVSQETSHIVRRIKDLEWQHFWKWTYFSDYFIFLVVLSACMGLLTWLLNGVPVYVEGLGYASLFIEACLGIPQFSKNYSNKSTEGMSVGMVLLWLAGDSIKTVYFAVRHSPLQFLMCGTLQCIVDVAVLAQVFIY